MRGAQRTSRTRIYANDGANLVHKILQYRKNVSSFGTVTADDDYPRDEHEQDERGQGKGTCGTLDGKAFHAIGVASCQDGAHGVDQYSLENHRAHINGVYKLFMIVSHHRRPLNGNESHDTTWRATKGI